MKEVNPNNQWHVQRQNAPHPTDRSADSFTPKQQSRLRTYQNILSIANHVENKIIEDGPSSFGICDPKTKRVTEKYMDLDQDFVSIWRKRAYNLYESDFLGDEKLENAADMIKESVDERDGIAETLTPTQLTDLWNRD